MHRGQNFTHGYCNTLSIINIATVPNENLIYG